MTAEPKKKMQDALRETREAYHKWVVEEILAFPDKSYSEIGRLYGVSEGTVYEVARLHGISRIRNNSDVPSTPGKGVDNV